MNGISSKLKSVATATAILFASSGTLWAQSSDLDSLLDRLQRVEAVYVAALETKIMLVWSKSGSAAMDFLLTRAKIAIELQDYNMAMVHLNALTDHAPDFAEGWNLSAVALYNMLSLIHI